MSPLLSSANAAISKAVSVKATPDIRALNMVCSHSGGGTLNAGRTLPRTLQASAGELGRC
jgi:hypothetical protein